MIRRPPTTIGLTADDLAIFEKQYASGEIYAHHQADTTNGVRTQRAQRQNGIATPASARDGGSPAAEDADAEEVREHDRGQTQMQLDEGEKQARTRDQRILGTTGRVDAAAAVARGFTDSGGESGVAGGGAQTMEQQQQQPQPQR